MREAVIISSARTPIGKAYRGAFNNTEAPTLGGHAIRHAVERAGIEPGEVEEVFIGLCDAAGIAGTQYRTTDRTRCWPPGNNSRHFSGPAVFVRNDGNCARGEDYCQ